MKKLALMFVVLCGSILIASPGWALYLADGTYIGIVDTYIAADNLDNYGDHTELDWINDTLFGDDTSAYYTAFNKFDYQPAIYDVYSRSVYDDDQDSWIADVSSLMSSAFAFELPTDPVHYFVKFGSANGAYAGIALWENRVLSNWGVIDLTDVAAAGLEVLEISAFSHWGEAGGTSSVPEPSTMLLMGLGLVGLAGIGRRKLTS